MALDSDQSPPFYPLTKDNHGALVVVTAIIFFIYALLGIVGKLIIRLNITSMKDFDLLLLGSAAIYFCQTACVVAACNHGLGEHRKNVSDEDFASFSKVGFLVEFFTPRCFRSLTSVETVDLCRPNTRIARRCYDKDIVMPSHQADQQHRRLEPRQPDISRCCSRIHCGRYICDSLPMSSS